MRRRPKWLSWRTCRSIRRSVQFGDAARDPAAEPTVSVPPVTSNGAVESPVPATRWPPADSPLLRVAASRRPGPPSLPADQPAAEPEYPLRVEPPQCAARTRPWQLGRDRDPAAVGWPESAGAGHDGDPGLQYESVRPRGRRRATRGHGGRRWRRPGRRARVRTRGSSPRRCSRKASTATRWRHCPCSTRARI